MRVLRKVMLKNNNHNSSCATAEQIVSYLYDEAGANEKSEFQAHLAECASCAGEVAGFGLVRSSIGDWREEFCALETPVIEIPDLKQPRFMTNQTVSTVGRSRLADFRSLFLLSPAWKSAAAAFAALTVGVVLALFVFSGGKPEIAANGNQKIEKPEVSPLNSVENKSIETVETINRERLPNPSPDSDIAESKPNNSIRKKKGLRENTSAKIADSSSQPKMVAPKSNSLAVRGETKLNIENKTTNAQKRQVPKLSNLSEEEDKSLRLADLFDEIDAK